LSIDRGQGEGEKERKTFPVSHIGNGAKIPVWQDFGLHIEHLDYHVMVARIQSLYCFLLYEKNWDTNISGRK
jgi:hypothetical protein